MRCPRHPDRTAAQACVVCGAYFCAECLAPVAKLDGEACAPCAAAGSRTQPVGSGRPRLSPRVPWIAALLLVPLASAALAGLLVRPSPADQAHSDLVGAYAALEQTGLALQAHRAAEGKLPDQLESLVPEYLSALPSDPFSSGPLRYGAPPGAPGARVLYSLGPDRTDQGGRPLDPETGRGDLGYPLR